MNDGLIGIANIGNTCYMNSIIQCISNCTPFRNYLLNKHFVECLAHNINEKYKLNDESLIMNKFNETITYQLYKIIKMLWINVNNNIIKPHTFKELFGDKINNFYGYSQHDAQEALNGLFMLLESELHRKSPINRINDGQKMDGYKKWNEYYEKNNNIITDIFTGLYHIETICPICSNITDSYEHFNCLTLSIDNKDGTTIDDCLYDFCKGEVLDDNNKLQCDVCNKKVNSLRKFYIWKKPQILIILFKRFCRLQRNKNNNIIDFPINNFDINNYLSKLNREPNNHSYNLISICNHIGNQSGGHYFSYCKNGNNWYKFDDNNVSMINGDIVTRNAYLLFYELS